MQKTQKQKQDFISEYALTSEDKKSSIAKGADKRVVSGRFHPGTSIY